MTDCRSVSGQSYQTFNQLIMRVATNGETAPKKTCFPQTFAVRARDTNIVLVSTYTVVYD